MRHLFGSLKTERAAALPITLLITIIVLTIVYAIFSLASQDAILSTRDAQVSAAFYAAESGIGTAEAWLEAALVANETPLHLPKKPKAKAMA